ncbi:MAG TPA: exonuclease domain-containing protein, partial [Flavobacteriales bacterium]|nr:exonuclease domain-containing protein [Flavobacteriales bacterium]
MSPSQFPPDLAAQRLQELSFMAIDVETANEQRNSLCAVAVVQVQAGVVTRTWKSLVCPPELRVEAINRSIHRIEEHELRVAPSFSLLWEQLAVMLEGQLVVAHNAEFDMNVLQQTLAHYTLRAPAMRSLCTLKLAHVAFPALDDYRLADVASYLGLPFRHHACEEDARVCAQIAVQGIPRVSLSRFSFDEADLTSTFVKAPSRSAPQGLSAVFADKDFDRTLLKPDLSIGDPTHPFYNKRLVFTGDLNSMPRSEAAERVRALGTDINTSISRKTQIVVMGKGAGPSKLMKIEELKSQGVEIWVVQEE